MQFQSNNNIRQHLSILLHRFVHVVRHPVAHMIHRWKFDVLIKPGHAGFAGGVFNPGAIVLDNGSMLMMAKGQVIHWRDALRYCPEQFMVGAPVLLKLKTPMARKISAIKVLTLKEFPADGFKAEDFRLFNHDGDVLVNHSMIRSNQHETHARPALSRLCGSAGELHFLGYPQLDIDLVGREKNWVYLEVDGRLLLFYSFSPFRVLELVDKERLTFATITNLKLDSMFTNLGGFGSLTSLSVNPIEYDDKYFLLVVHQIERKDGNRRYHHWGVLLNRTTLVPERITKRPLFNAVGARGRCKNVLYIMAVVNSGDEFCFLCGEGDSYVTRGRVSRAALERSFME